MKKLLLLLMFIPLVSFGQNETTINLNKTIGYAEPQGLKYLGQNTYAIQLTSEMNFSKKNLEKRILKQIEDMAKNYNANYKILSTDKWGTFGNEANVRTTFVLTNKDGTEIINKNDAKKQLLELKEYLDLGIITQEEFDKKAVSLKKILLGN